MKAYRIKKWPFCLVLLAGLTCSQTALVYKNPGISGVSYLNADNRKVHLLKRSIKQNTAAPDKEAYPFSPPLLMILP